MSAVPPAAAAHRRPQQRLRIAALAGAGLLAGGLLLASAGDLWEDFLQLRVRGEAMTRERGHVAATREEVERRFKQGVAMLHMRQYDHALTAFHRVLELAPQMPEVHVNMGFALLGQGQHKAAADFFSSALALKVDQANAYYGLALALEGQGDLEAALGAMRTFAHLARPDDPYREKAQVLIRQLDEALPQSRARAGTAPGGRR